MATTATTVSTTATIPYTASAYDTLPGIASRLYAQSGYGSFNDLITKIMVLNVGVVQDWTASLAGLSLLIPTVGR